MDKWYVVEQAESHIIGEGHQEFTTDKHYAEYLLKKLTKQRDLGMIDYVPIMREATEEETALLDFDFDFDSEDVTGDLGTSDDLGSLFEGLEDDLEFN